MKFMKKIFLLLSFLLIAPVFVAAQAPEQHYLYNIVTFSGNLKKEGLKVNVDDGRSVEKLRDAEGNRIEFKTPAAALMYFISRGWELYVNGATTSGSSYMTNGTGGGSSSTTSYWIFRKPCTKEEFDKAVAEGIND